MYCTPEELDDLPKRRGFRLRGVDMTRIETFTDAAFAFALTLLVISIDEIPGTYQELVDALLGAPAFAASVAILMYCWSGHHQWSRRFGMDDGISIVLSVALVFTLLVYVYPLKALMSLFVAWIAGQEMDAVLTITSARELYGVFAIYAVGWIALCGIIVLLNVHALRKHERLHLNELERFDTVAAIREWSAATCVGVLSLLLALFTEPSRWALPGQAWFLMPIIMPTIAIISGRQRDKRFGKQPYA